MGTDALTKTHLDLLRRRIIDINGMIDGEVALYVRTAVAHLMGAGNPEVTVLLTSTGGETEMGFHIFDTLRLYPGKKTVRVLCFAHSMAAVLLQVGDHREFARHATMLLHNVRGTLTIPHHKMRDRKTLARLFPSMDTQQKRIVAILSERTGMPKRLVVKLLETESELSAKEALKYRLIDQII